MILRISRRHAMILGLASVVGSRLEPRPAQAGSVAPVRKGYLPGRCGQLHYRVARPEIASGITPVVCLHNTPFAGRIFESLLPLLGADRVALAPDTPGYGDSDPPDAPPSIADYAAMLVEALDVLQLKEPVDLLGYETGAAIAVEIANQLPEQIRRLILIDLPVGTDFEPPEPYEVLPAGLHLQTAWDRYVAGAQSNWSIERAQYHLTDAVRCPAISHWGHYALAAYPLAKRLATLKQPTLMIDLRERGWGWGFLDSHPTETVALVRGFLDRSEA